MTQERNEESNWKISGSDKYGEKAHFQDTELFVR